MEEKYKGIWCNIEDDNSSKVVFEIYIASIDKLHIIYERSDTRFIPYSFVKQKNHQLRSPIWSVENEKAILPTLESAKEYLINYSEKHT